MRAPWASCKAWVTRIQIVRISARWTSGTRPSRIWRINAMVGWAAPLTAWPGNFPGRFRRWLWVRIVYRCRWCLQNSPCLPCRA